MSDYIICPSLEINVGKVVTWSNSFIGLGIDKIVSVNVDYIYIASTEFI